MLTIIKSTVLPPSGEAEEAVLGALMLDNARAKEIDGFLSEADFNYSDYRLIYRQIMRLIAQGESADVLMVAAHLENEHPGRREDWVEMLATFAQNTPSASRVRHYAEIVRELAIARANMPAQEEDDE